MHIDSPSLTTLAELRFADAAEILEHISDAAVRLERMPQFLVHRDPVNIAATNLGDCHVRGVDQLGHDLLHYSLGRSHPPSYFVVAGIQTRRPIIHDPTSYKQMV